MKIITRFNKSLFASIKILMVLFLCLQFLKINLVIGKNKTQQNNSYTTKKMPLKRHNAYKHTTNKQNNINHHNLLAGASEVSNDLSIWSNSFNFAKGNSEVDPRTGTLLVSMKVGLLRSNFGHGPDIDLEMNYNSGAKGDPDHLGCGWAWNLTHYNPTTHQLNTAGGKSFFLEQLPDGSWHPLYHKLKDVIITHDKKRHMIIKSSNGLQDILDHDGYEIRMEQQNGDGVNFDYMPGSHILKKITDDNGNSILLIRKGNYLTVSSYDVSGHLVNMHISLENNKVRNIWFPGSNDQHTVNDSGLVHLSYTTYNNSQDLLTGIHYFTGMEKQFIYNCSDEMKLPDIISNQNPFQPFASMCVVKQVRMIPGAKQLPINVVYSYTSTNSNNHDYLGFNASLTGLPDLKRDILFEAPASYTYKTKEDNGQIQTIRTYNKYHLLIDTKVVSDKTDKPISESIVYFCRTDKEDGCANTSFNQLPDTWSLPLKIVSKNWGDNISTPLKTTINRSYDDYGRLISETDSYGRKTKTIYCQQNGDSHCPVAPTGWPVATLAEKTEVFPALLKNSTQLSPVITTMNYQKEENRNKPGYTLVLYKNSVQSGNEQRTETRWYYQDKNNPLTYGLLKQKQLTGTNLPAESVKKITHHYQYTLNNNGSETAADYIDTANNQSVSSLITEKSIFSPKILRVISEDKKNIQTFEYDALGRLTVRTDATGTPFTATTRNQYRLSANENSVIVTMPNGMQKKVVFDGAGRKLATYLEKTDLQGHLQPGLWQQQTQISYNAKGEVATSTHYTQSQGSPVALTTRFDYDILGRLIRKHLSNGETEVTKYDNAHRCVVHYNEDTQNNRTAITIDLISVTGKPLEQIMLPATTGILPPVGILCILRDKQPGSRVFRMTYDGFNRLVSTEDPMGRMVQKRYDALGHVIDIINPIGDKIHNVYDLTGHVIQRLFIPVQGGQYLLASAGFNAAGQKLWSAGEDGKKNIYHYNINGQMSYIYKANGHHITLSYNNIGLPVADSLDGKVFLQVSYDHTHHKPLTVTDNTGVTTYHYRNDGLLASTIHKGINGYASSVETLNYNSYHHLVSRTDSQRNKIIYTLDKLVRPLEKTYQENNGNTTQIKQLFYDSFSRIIKEVYGSGMIRMLAYNPWGQVETVKDRINGKPLHTESFVYDANGNIIRLQRSDDKNHQATIHYRYDRLDNLVSMNCKGDYELCPHDTAVGGDKLKAAPAIIQQNYKFTRLNRLEGVTEKLIDTSSSQWHSLSKTMSYTYTNVKVPLRLTEISTKWNDQQSATHHLIYDIAGNMNIDSQGNKMIYNPFNQITQVINTVGLVSRYDYNGQGKEVKEVTKEGIRQMLYQGEVLSSEIVTDTANNLHRISYPSAEIKITDNKITDWNETNYKGDVISVLKQDKTSKQWTVQQHNVYSPYGMVWSYGKQKTTVPAFQQTLKGFDGEITDAATGWQFLGAGHRTYNPYQRYFVSEDPAGDGYAFGSNNPIMNSDPSGNMPKWLGKPFKLANTVFSLGMRMAHNKFIRGIGRSLMWGAMGLTLGSTVAIGQAFAAPTALAFASTVKPANKGLQKASMVTGRVFSGALFVAGLASIIAGIGAAAASIIGAAGGGLIGAEGEGVAANEGLLAMAEALNNMSEGAEFEAIANILENSGEESLQYSLNFEESGNSANGSEMLAGANINADMSESNESVAAGNANGWVEGIPKFKRAILGPSDIENIPVNSINTGVITFYDCDIGGSGLLLNDPLEDITKVTGENVYDEILQIYIREDCLALAYAALKPGGRLHVIATDIDEAANWLFRYGRQGQGIFGEDKVGFIDETEIIQNIMRRFDAEDVDGWTYNIMMVFQKANA